MPKKTKTKPRDPTLEDWAGSNPTPLQQAQDLCWDAWDETDTKKARRMARKALKICPDCADAYNILGGSTASWKKAAELYEQGVAVGRKTLGEAYFKRNEGHFWGLLESRPYIRAVNGLADCYWHLDRYKDSVRLYQEILRLNPGDNIGVRFILVSKLIILQRDDEARSILKRYPGEERAVAFPAYTTTLLEFRRSGDSPKARKALEHAMTMNPHVPDYLLRIKPLPGERPGYYSPGDESEAEVYVDDGFDAWRLSHGAMNWLLERVKAGQDVH